MFAKFINMRILKNEKIAFKVKINDFWEIILKINKKAGLYVKFIINNLKFFKQFVQNSPAA